VRSESENTSSFFTTIDDNVVVHNIIDSEHKMEVNICLNDQMSFQFKSDIYEAFSTKHKRNWA